MSSINRCFSQLVFKRLVDSSLRQGRKVENEQDFLPLQQLFVLLEMVFKHGFKSGEWIFLSVDLFSRIHGKARTSVNNFVNASINNKSENMDIRSPLWFSLVHTLGNFLWGLLGIQSFIIFSHLFWFILILSNVRKVSDSLDQGWGSASLKADPDPQILSKTDPDPHFLKGGSGWLEILISSEENSATFYFLFTY